MGQTNVIVGMNCKEDTVRLTPLQCAHLTPNGMETFDPEIIITDCIRVLLCSMQKALDFHGDAVRLGCEHLPGMHAISEAWRHLIWRQSEQQ